MECTCILKFSKWAPLPWKPDDLWKTSIGCFWLPAQQIFMKLYSNYPCIECNWYMQKNQERFDKCGRRCHRNKKRGEGIWNFFIFHPNSMKLHMNITYYELMCTQVLKFSKWVPLPWKQTTNVKISIGFFSVSAGSICLILYRNYPCIKWNWFIQKKSGAVWQI